MNIRMKLVLASLISVCTFAAILAETRSFEVSDFSKISAGYAMKLEIVQGATFAVEITTSPEIFQYLEVEKRGDSLKLSVDARGNWNSPQDEIEVFVRMPVLTGLDLGGAAMARLVGMDSGGSSFQLGASGASRVVGELNCADIDLDASGASRVELVGEARSVDLDASGASRVDLREFFARDAQVDLSGASTARVAVNGQLRSDQSGGSRLVYYGDPTLERIRSSGGASVRKGDGND